MSDAVGTAISRPETEPDAVAQPVDSEPPRARRLGWRNTHLALLSLGSLLNLVAYASVMPHLAAIIHYSAGMALLRWPKFGGLYERRTFSRLFAVGFVMAGVAAIYANHLQDPGQLGSDAMTFFDFASGRAEGIALGDLTIFFEGALAVVIWRALYDAFAALGFSREPYVGIMLNVSAVAMTGVLAIRIARQVYGHDPYRFQRLIHLFSTCGLIWLFAGIHIRDSMVLFAVTVLVYAWLYFLTRPDLSVRLVQLVTVSGVAALFFMFLRREFVFVPIAMAMAGVAALLLGRKTRQNRITAYVLLAFGMAGVAALLSTYFGRILLALTTGQEGYLELAADTHGSDSLGMRLIANQPLPIRLVLGSIALILLPIPVWIGFQLESVYHLFGSLNAIFFYFFTPLLAVAVRQLWKRRELRTPAFLFILLAPAGFTLAVAGTSVETRHFGAFLVPLFVLALLPDLRERAERHNYRQLLGLMLASVMLVHALWVFLKVV